MQVKRDKLKKLFRRRLELVMQGKLELGGSHQTSAGGSNRPEAGQWNGPGEGIPELGALAVLVGSVRHSLCLESFSHHCPEIPVAATALPLLYGVSAIPV